MDVKKIKKAIKEERINITEHADEELEDDEISNQDLYASRIPNSYHILRFPVSIFPAQLPSSPPCFVAGSLGSFPTWNVIFQSPWDSFYR